MFELIEGPDTNRAWRKVWVWGAIGLIFLSVLLRDFFHHDLFYVIFFPLLYLIGTEDYWKRMKKYCPGQLWVIIRIIPPILMAAAGWYQSWIFLLISLIGSALVLIGLETYLKRRTRNQELLAETGEAQK
jgi:hypothetical protein